jgi:hypothetical protein
LRKARFGQHDRCNNSQVPEGSHDTLGRISGSIGTLVPQAASIPLP